MENTSASSNHQSKDNSIVFYVLGGVVVTAIIVAGFLLYPRNQQPSQTPEVQGTQQAAVMQPTEAPKGPISGLTCTQQYYNTVNGVVENYYLTTEGEAPTSSGDVTCSFTATINNAVVASAEVKPTMIAATDRGGATFKCTTQGLKLKANVPVKVATEVKDSSNNSITCNRAFLLP